MGTEFRIDIFLFGCLGALAPEVVRLYNLRTKGNLSWSGFYILVSIAFSLLGGVIAWILNNTNPYGAFYTGVALPNILNAIARNTNPDIPPPPDPPPIEPQASTSPKTRSSRQFFWRNFWRGL